MIRTLTIAAILAMTGQVGIAACADHEGMCETASGGYHIEVPDVENPPLLVFLHGYGGSAKGILKNRNMVEPLLKRGYAVMAPEGSDRNGRQSWNFFPGWEGRDETAFLTEAVRDAEDRFGVDVDHTVLGGFSAGAFMVYYLACAAPQTFSAYVPVSGGFWRPLPENCNGPIRMFHTHGWTDNVVPLEGRVLGGGRFHQGDIFAGLEIWRVANKCIDTKPSGFSVTGRFMRRYWSGCTDGSMLEVALFPGGHNVPKGWADMIVDWYEGLPGN